MVAVIVQIAHLVVCVVMLQVKHTVLNLAQGQPIVVLVTSVQTQALMVSRFVCLLAEANKTVA